MRIDQSPLSLTQAVGQPQASEAASKTHRHCTAGDRVQISEMAAQLSTDPARLARLQAAFASGTYHVSPNKIAYNMITDALEAG